MAAGIPGNQIRQLLWGLKVSRATATLPQGANAPIFNILNGRVLLTALVGEVTVVLGAVGNMKLIATPTTGTAADMCAVTAMGSKEVGTLISISGNASDALVAVSSGFVRGFGYDGVVVDIGTINLSLSGSSTGSVKWDLFYTPLDDGASVTAA